MLKDRIPTDSTIASIANCLENPDHYVSQVYGKARRATKEHGNSVAVRIGVLGTGAKPNYRTERVGESDSVFLVLASYRGDNHMPLFEVNDDLESSNWSERTMSVEELGELLGKIRNFVPK
ncbi:conserved hypothetical protein [Mesorhizobium metallidurans STM 2683]|uniref:Uncharacterized protein n=1 Tax=Mesorhizobium metallidurans STM 2683 TaxID=1297569 RepID=M5EQU9_9HYPH|nr:hypothetical protein [Mesorhizobium metallidurans]CCV06480.1 conserved hypothetical protein [Mesorhizobium metallidurans STM 2683]